MLLGARVFAMREEHIFGMGEDEEPQGVGLELKISA
jgi:hypothetical protein